MEFILSLASFLGALLIGVISPGPKFVLVARTSMAASRIDGIFTAIGGVVFSAVVLLGLQDALVFGRFETVMQPTNVPGVLHAPGLAAARDKIDVEIAGNRPDRILANVYHNPGDEGTRYDYGYRGAPTYIELGFDASRSAHCFSIEWGPNEIRWLVDGRLVHRRVYWGPTPIPHPSYDPSGETHGHLAPRNSQGG